MSYLRSMRDHETNWKIALALIGAALVLRGLYWLGVQVVEGWGS